MFFGQSVGPRAVLYSDITPLNQINFVESGNITFAIDKDYNHVLYFKTVSKGHFSTVDDITLHGV